MYITTKHPIPKIFLRSFLSSYIYQNNFFFKQTSLFRNLYKVSLFACLYPSYSDYIVENLRPLSSDT